MASAEQFAQRVEYYCENDNYGYDQTYRWGQYGDFDCSSLMYQCGYDIGMDLTTSGYRYTGDMIQNFSAAGCEVLSLNTTNYSQLLRGDILLNVASHTVCYLGNGKVGGARINEKGTATGGTPGDQTGKEICVHDYYNYPWDYVLRIPASSSEGEKYYGRLDVDGYWGENTSRRLQTVFDTYVDGEIWHQWPENKQSAFTGGWCYDYTLAGSPVIRSLQSFLNSNVGLSLSCDGIIGAATIRGLQRYFGTTVDGTLWAASPCVMKMQEWLNGKL